MDIQQSLTADRFRMDLQMVARITGNPLERSSPAKRHAMGDRPALPSSEQQEFAQDLEQILQGQLRRPGGEHGKHGGG
ncbi:hypothetical protein [Roseovarius sp.]|uniref:hypothetical protein n=1 Tax=Roseovarius sp. TaxID=1486281 RepID=UPI00356B466C